MKLLLNRVDQKCETPETPSACPSIHFGTAERPRLNVYRSLANIYAQVINDETGETIVLPALLKKIEKPITAAT